MNNFEIAEHFVQLAKLLDLHGENTFKIKSYSNAAYTIEHLADDVALMDDTQLYSIKGIGDAIGKKIRELAATGKLSLLEKMKSQTPEGVIEIMNIKGLGAKKAATIWKDLGIESVGELEYACHENRLVSLKGFGIKTQESLLKNIEFLKLNKGLFLWTEAKNAADIILADLRKSINGCSFEITGDLRRQCPTVALIEFITNSSAKKLTDYFSRIESIDVEMNGDCLFVQIPNTPKLKFLISDAINFQANLFLTTGNEKFIEHFRQNFSWDGNASSESEIFEKNKLQFILPALREGNNIFKLASERKIPALIQTTDIKGVIHAHSKWSDGGNTIHEMALTAQKKGYEYLVLTDHSQTAAYAGGLKPERIIEQHKEIDELNKLLYPFKIFKGIESDILGDGSLDYDEKILAGFDIVIASVHSNLKMTEDKAMERILKAIQNPYTTILGHPTGRLLLSRKGYPLDMKLVIEACATNGVIIEINAHPRRLDLDWQWIDYAQQCGVLLSINPDAHSLEGIKDIEYGIMASQKGGLQAKNNFSSFTREQIEEYIVGRKSIK